ncbi:C-X-C motif chemokine 10 isoform X1 [Salmo salar]|uniref:C-X-C motif chemokine 10 n=2 Tax=Salmo TaxID=8028 RepID=B5XED9_SALSA|nr:C-X-C motif chemokine 10 isoform X1 [Salmo salar]ACI69209.1 C-X-C motif chemokine 10 precursor [Salmo salar]|eukprot:XP_013983422.1 PREDICTED: C-X-C motif chemokine 10 isoform X1 [Salmo salar]
MRTATLILLCVTVFGAGFAQFPGGRSEKCLCRGKLIQSVRIKRIQKLEVYPNSVFCAKTEIIATMKNGKKKCLNPEGKLGKRFLMRKRLEEQQKPKGGLGRKNKNNSNP